MAENQNIEWKESWRDEYLRWVCGFANAQGGKIYIGKDDKGRVTGVINSKKLLDDIPNKVRQVLGIIVDVNLYTEDSMDYLEIVVKPSQYPVSYYGEYHYRTGSTKQLLTGQSLTQFLMEKTGITWDSVPIPRVKVDEMRNDSFDIFREQAVLSGRMMDKDVEGRNAHLLDSLNLVQDYMLKRAGILLFHHNPEKWVQGAYVKIGYFESESDLRYQDEIHGSLLSQATQVVDLIYTKYLKADIKYVGVTRVERYPYPKKAVREAIFNALVHKNYSTLIPIQIKVYEDRLSISNDCVFPADWSIDDLLGSHRSRPYNPLIANTFFRAGFIESWGRGIWTINECCDIWGIPQPEYVIKPTEFEIVFHMAKSTESMTDIATESMTESMTDIATELERTRLSSIITYLKVHEVITTRDAANILQVSYRTASRLLAKAVALQILTSTGKTKMRAYRMRYEN